MQSSKKDKCEGELKKEIKRLQRYDLCRLNSGSLCGRHLIFDFMFFHVATLVCRDREQIRSWLSSQEGLVYRDGLESVKRDIEAEMERFKILEKCLKVKAFSKEGLILQVTFLPLLNEEFMTDALTGSCFNEGLRRTCDAFLSSSHE